MEVIAIQIRVMLNFDFVEMTGIPCIIFPLQMKSDISQLRISGP